MNDGKKTDPQYRTVRKQDRFLPCLVIRLMDNEPQNRIDHQPLLYNIAQLKNSVLKNLEMILNSTAPSFPADRKCAGIVRDSCLFFGLPNFTGMTKSRDAMEELRGEVIRQIRCFEPRIDAKSLEVVLQENPECQDEIMLTVSGMIVAETVRDIVVYERKIAWNAGNLSLLPQAQNGVSHG